MLASTAGTEAGQDTGVHVGRPAGATAAAKAAVASEAKARASLDCQWLQQPVTGAAPPAVLGAGAAAADGCLLVFGGVTPSGAHSNTVHSWVTESASWQLVNTAAAGIPAPRAGAAVATIASRLYVLSGLAESGWPHGLHSLDLGEQLN